MRTSPDTILWRLLLTLLLCAPLASAQIFVEPDIIDNCDRTEDPLSNGGQWSTSLISDDPSRLEATGSTCRKDTGIGIGSAWDDSLFGADVALSVTVPDATSGAATPFILMYVRLAQPGVLNATDGYSCGFWPKGSEVVLERLDDSTSFTTLNTCSLTISDGDKLGCRMVGNTITAHQNTGAGWTQVCSGTDSTYTTAGAVGLRTGHSDMTFDDIRAGTVASAGAQEALQPLLQ